MTRASSNNQLATAAVAFLAANLLHGADHLRQGIDGLDVAIKAGGFAITLAAVGVVVLAVKRHPAAPLAATLVGFMTTLLVTASHVVPHWSVFSDSYVDDVRVDGLSWAVVLAEIVAAFVLGCVGMSKLRDTSRFAVTTHG